MYTALKAAHLKLEDCKHLSSDIHFQLHGVAFTPHAHTVVVRTFYLYNHDNGAN